MWLDGSDDPESRVEALDFPTILTSKQVARRVGEHGVRKLLSSLDELHRQGTLGRYILVGHSLGGVVALHARKQAMLDNLAAGRGETHLTVLLNPAASAKEYQPLDKWLSPEGFGPSMLVLQSKTDFAVREAFNWIKDGERAVGNSWAITHDVDPCSGVIVIKWSKSLSGCLSTMRNPVACRYCKGLAGKFAPDCTPAKPYKVAKMPTVRLCGYLLWPMV